jgi:hypothetical protein
MEISSWIIGTIILWVLKSLGTLPLAGFLSRSREARYTPPTESENPQSEEVASAGENKEVEAIPAGYYILADALVLGVAGFLLGLITGYYFIGISWKAKDWPGMIAFVVASLVGSSLGA